MWVFCFLCCHFSDSFVGELKDKRTFVFAVEVLTNILDISSLKNTLQPEFQER
jgi:hypothetical protein